MTDHAFKGRGELTLGATTLEVSTEIGIRIETDAAPIAHWPNLATGDAPGGIKEVAQRVRGVYVDIALHDYAPTVLATALGGTVTTGAATGTQDVNLLSGDTTTTYALAFAGYNKLDNSDWDFSMPRFRPEIIETLPVVSDSIAGYRLRGHSLRDTTATGREYGYLTIATG